MAQRGEGGELKLLFTQGPTILNPHLAQGSKDHDASRPVLEPLAVMGPDGKPEARLAAEVPTRANGGVALDGTSVTWKLKQGVKWSDGTGFTADDVVFTYQLMANPAVAATTAQTVGNVASVTATDQYTIVVKYKQATADPYQWGIGSYGAILQKAQFKDFNGANIKDAPGNQRPIGTGPYKVKDFKPNDIVLYEINDQYRDKDKPYFKTVQIKTVNDSATAARGTCETGDADYGWSLQLPVDQLQTFLKTGKCNLLAIPGSSIEQINFQYTNPDPALGDKRAEPGQPHPFLIDLNVRKALAMTINRTLLAEQVWGNGITGSATCNVITQPPDITSQNTKNMDVCKYDPAAAAKLLDSAGWVKGSDGIRAKNGVKMSVVFQTTVSATRQIVQQVIKKDWEALGVKVELKAVPSGVFFSSDAANPDTWSKFWADVQEYGGGYSSPDPQVYLSTWTTSEIKTRADGWRGKNANRYSNPEYDALYGQLVKELDPAKRRDLVIKLNDHLVQNVVLVPLVANQRPISTRVTALKGPVENVWEGDLWNIADWRK
ncbi:MAG TPA: peptide ABC transporter substrate-binding protein [Candidatus Limnocylindria bacterium]|nr:peptide ABC transporter substrate-binding protein [Candidatus Limnocylindria bacterium]